MKKESNDHRVRITKLLIRRSFTDLLKTKPIQSISVKELSDRAGINRGTFYSHYQDIYALLEEIENDMLIEFSQALEPLQNDSTKKRNLADICNGIFYCLKKNSDMCTFMVGDYNDKELMSKLLNTGKEFCINTYHSLFPKATIKEIEYFYSFVSTGCIGLIRKWIEEGMVLPTEEIARMAESMIMGGIGYLENPL